MALVLETFPQLAAIASSYLQELKQKKVGYSV
jgi:hypothetical protein